MLYNFYRLYAVNCMVEMMLLIKFSCVILLYYSAVRAEEKWEPLPICIDEIEEFNKNSLVSSLQDGWNSFCKYINIQYIYMHRHKIII